MIRRKRVLEIEGQKKEFKHIGHKTKQLEIWYENERVRDVLTNMPYRNVVVEAFQAYKEDSEINYQLLLIIDNMDESDNWFYRRSKIWVVTLKCVLETIDEVLSRQNIDAEPLRRFIRSDTQCRGLI
ncbi:hypothetical protein ABE430_25210 [Brevibacillus agri]|uniref:hypothetical protein n=1 Tax=Brevibacillus TaxID=55080 RepID=UPI002E1BB30D|nr:hypothetical protein [Brevibacillus borstelensis]